MAVRTYVHLLDRLSVSPLTTAVTSAMSALVLHATETVVEVGSEAGDAGDASAAWAVARPAATRARPPAAAINVFGSFTCMYFPPNVI
ncbi:MAG: hypothetical protein ABSA03_20805 [Streptosporangiaceae bacterium]